MPNNAGSKYAMTRGLSYAQIAQLIRSDIKHAVSEGRLPANAKYSVRTRTFSGGGAIDVVLKDLPGAWVPQDDAKCAGGWCNTHDYHYDGCPAAEHLSTTAANALEVLREIHSSYNYNDSDSMTDYFDVNYYGRPEVERLYPGSFAPINRVAAAI
jgi:hypothetical protein